MNHSAFKTELISAETWEWTWRVIDARRRINENLLPVVEVQVRTFVFVFPEWRLMGMNGMKNYRNEHWNEEMQLFRETFACRLPECGAHNEFGLWRNNFCNHLFIHRVLFIAPLASARERDGSLLWLQASEPSGLLLLLSAVLGHFLFQLCGQIGFCVFRLLLHFRNVCLGCGTGGRKAVGEDKIYATL